MDLDKIWQKTLKEIRPQVTKAVFNTCFKKTALVSLDKQEAVIGVSHFYFGEKLKKEYRGLIKKILGEFSAEEIKNLSFVIKESPSPFKRETSLPPLLESLQKYEHAAQEAGLRKDFTFENFAVSSTNEFAHAAGVAAASSPGKAYNPLFFYGGVGVGKTHLSQAIAHQILQKNPKSKLIYCTGEEFTNEIVDAIRSKTTKEFKKKYRSIKVFLIDDIQFIAGKVRAQEEFFHTFNAVIRAGGQIVLTSDKPPDEIARLEERLRSRFEAGLTVDIQKPDFELRTAILLIKAKQKNKELSMEVARFLASNIETTRKIEGVLTTLIGLSQMKEEEISLEMCQRVLGEAARKSKPKKEVSPQKFLKTLCSYYKIKPAQIREEKRNRFLARPRQVLMYLLRNETEMTLSQIGEFLGGRDHTTIIHGVEKIGSLMADSEGLRVDISGIKKRIFGDM